MLNLQVRQVDRFDSVKGEDETRVIHGYLVTFSSSKMEQEKKVFFDTLNDFELYLFQNEEKLFDHN